MTQTAAPAYRYRTMGIETASKRGLAGETFTADELREFLPADGGEGVLWTSMGAAGGSREMFGTSRMRVGERGIEVLGRFEGCPVGSTQVVLVHPFGVGREIRVLTRKP